jgi:primosomal protein N' (replication factor Y)
MIAKGLDFPKVTLVGVISADTALNLPDFRAAERTFCLMTQVAGRAGRGKLPGRVVVQTSAPHHYAIQAAKRHDYEAFYKQEIAIRRQLKLPPFTRLVELTARSMQETSASAWASQLAEQFRKNLPPEIEVLGPAPAPIPKLRRQYRWHLILKAPTIDWHLKYLPALLEKTRPPKGCRLAVDVDPL